jgi:tetratricopeptide (TPR) repeat protein
VALALVQLKSYNAAAYKLDALARERDAGDAGMRADLLDQAGNAWLLAGQPENATASFSAAINLGAADADVLSDRARAKAMLKDWTGADTDLTAALAKDRYRADLLVLRASARHAMGRRAEAFADIAGALDIDPRYADALVERGAMKLENGDKAGARADWQIVLATQPDSPAADSARQRIEQLELSGTSQPVAKKPSPTRH